VKEAYTMLEKTSWTRLQNQSNQMFSKQKRKALPEHIIREKSPNSTIHYSRLFATGFFRLRLDAMKT
jgi:hypothetical protein